MALTHLLSELTGIAPEEIDRAERHRQAVGGSLPRTLVQLGLIGQEALDRALDRPPTPPREVAETGLEPQFLLHLLLKTLYVTGLQTPSALSGELKLHASIVDTLLEDARQKKLAQVLGSSGAVSDELRYELTDLGRKWALDALEQSRYVGPAPVSLDVYRMQVMKHSLERESVSRESLERTLGHLVLPDYALGRLGPAVNSGKSILLFGPSGNGKTSVAEAIAGAYRGTAYVPHCIEVDRQIITLFDPAIHRPVPEEEDDHRGGDVDPRWVRCRRPVVLTGGELTMEMLDLVHDPISNYYDAPAHIKASGGVFVIDDFGRQRVAPRELLNRWILPLERRVDFLTLRTGKKLKIPFDQLVVFSTNLPPQELMDEAMLRRVQYKLPLSAPSEEAYTEILRRVCEAHALKPPSQEVLDYLLRVFYPRSGTPLSAYHPRFVVEHAIASCDFESRPRALTVELAREALLNLVVTDVPNDE